MSRRSYRSSRGFRLRYSRRFSVHAFRTKFLFILRILKKWTYACSQTLKFLKKGIHAHDVEDEYHRRIGKMSELGSSRSMNGLLVSDNFMPRSHECRMRSLGRSNSFYTEAIADCLEFIKRNSVSDEDDEKTVNPTDEERPIDQYNDLNSNKTLCSS